MARAPALWIAIADGEHARFVRRDASNVLRTISAVDSASAHLRSRDIGSDRPGRSFESAGPAHHAVGEPQDLHRLEKDRFAQFVAGELNAAAAREAFDELLLVAPAHAMRELRGALNDGAVKKLVGTLEKDLVKTPDHELWSHVKDWVGPMHRPAG
jgi:protein required for attachment to host cells